MSGMTSTFGIRTSAFQKILEKTSSVISSKPNPAVLKYVKLSFISDDRMLIVESCESEGKSGVKCKIPVSVQDMVSEDFSALIDPSIVLKIVGKLRSEEITIESIDDGSKVILKSGNNKFDLNSMSPASFPRFPSSNSGKVFSISATTLKKMLSVVQPAINPNDSRLALTAICFDYVQGNIYTVGMDGRFGLIASKETEIPGISDFRILIPYNALTPLVKYLPDGEEVDVEYLLSDPDNADKSDVITIFFNTPAFSVVVKTLDKQFSKYPNWDKMLPGGIKSRRNEDIQFSFMTSCESFRDSVALASTVADKSKRLALSVQNIGADSNAKLHVSSASEIGSSHLEPIDCNIIFRNEAEFKVDVDGSLMEKVLVAMPSKQIMVKFNTNKPIGVVCDGGGEIFVGSIVCPMADEEVEESDKKE